MRALLAAGCLLLLFLPGAAAQAPTSSLRFAETPTGVVESKNATQVVPAVLILTLSNVFCSSTATFRADLAGAASPQGNASANATVTAIPGTPFVRFDVPAGAYGTTAAAPAGAPYSGRREVSFTVTADGFANETLVGVKLQAAMAPPSGDTCRGTGGIPSAQASADVTIKFAATDPVPPPPGPELPLPAGLVFLAIALAVVTLRRRQP